MSSYTEYNIEYSKNIYYHIHIVDIILLKGDDELIVSSASVLMTPNPSDFDIDRARFRIEWIIFVSILFPF